MRLAGKTVVVTGGAKGIGVHYCRGLAAEGAHVAILDIADGAPLAAELGAAAHFFACDVSDEASVRATVSAVLQWTGRIDALVNNAAVFATLGDMPVTEMPVELWDKVMAVNVRGPFLMVKHVAPAMIAAKSGSIVNIASGTAYKGLPLMAHYVTSKAAMLGFTRTLSRELGGHGIRVNTLAPGLVLSDSISANQEHLDTNRDRVIASRALKRDGYPEDLIGALVYLCSDESRFMSGQSLVVDGGSVNV